MKKYILALLILSVQSCRIKNTDDCHKLVRVVNNSDKDVYFQWSAIGSHEVYYINPKNAKI